jgi:hypothetical protein
MQCTMTIVIDKTKVCIWFEKPCENFRRGGSLWTPENCIATKTVSGVDLTASFVEKPSTIMCKRECFVEGWVGKMRQKPWMMLLTSWHPNALAKPPSKRTSYHPKFWPLYQHRIEQLNIPLHPNGHSSHSNAVVCDPKMIVYLSDLYLGSSGTFQWDTIPSLRDRNQLPNAKD